MGKNLIEQPSGEKVEVEEAATEENVQQEAGEEQEQQEEQKKLLHYCVFRIGKEEYGIPIDIIKEVVKYRKPAPLPQMPDYILGMTNIRGNIYGILDIEKFFDIGSDTVHKFLLVLDHEIYKMTIGIPDVPDSLYVKEEEIEELKSSTLKSLSGQKYLKGVIKRDNRMIILFDILSIIGGENFTTHSN